MGDGYYSVEANCPPQLRKNGDSLEEKIQGVDSRLDKIEEHLARIVKLVGRVMGDLGYRP